MSNISFDKLKNQTLTAIEGATVGSDKITFTTKKGKKFQLSHYQDCCERVSVEDITGDVADLLNTPILDAREESQTPTDYDYESATWTFYRLSTIKGTVVFRWLGESNGYYSESVDFEEVAG